MRNVLGPSLLLVLSVASVVQAQPGELSGRERAYTKGLESALGPVARSERVGFMWAPQCDGVASLIESTGGHADSSSSLRVTGLQLDLDGLIVRRLKLEDVDAARLFAGRSELGTRTPVVAELRGDQVVFVHGEAVRDAAFARRALDAAWRGLPCAHKVEATLANLGDMDLVIATTTHEGPIAASLLSTFSVSARKATESPSPGCRAVMQEGAQDVSVELVNGEGRTLTARLHADDSARAWIWTTRDANVGTMARYFEVLTGLEPGHVETRQQRDGLEDVLTRTHASRSDGSIEMAGSGQVAPFPMGDEITTEAAKAVRASIDAQVGELSETAKRYGGELETARAGKGIVDRPLGE